jgi:hypothetical protein
VTSLFTASAVIDDDIMIIREELIFFTATAVIDDDNLRTTHHKTDFES